MSVETFGIEKKFLQELLRQVRDGRVQLPEFQRGWVWPERNITALLSSISLGYPVGTLMMLRTGGTARFKQRAVEGVELSPAVTADRLLLDGQQRLTSLFQALMLGEAVSTPDGDSGGWFYVDIRMALDETVDREEAFRFVPADRVVRSGFGKQIELDLSSPAKEYEAGLFPLKKVFDPDEWAEGFEEHHDYDKDVRKLWNTFNRTFIKRFEQYLMPVIELAASTPREAVCQVFEKVNTGGVTLTVFELLTATYAADEFDLRQDWRERRSAWDDPALQVLSTVSETDFLQAVTLLATYERKLNHAGADSDRASRVGCRRTEMLRLPLQDYVRFAPEAVTGLLEAARFLHRQYIFDVKYLPYGTQLIPLAAILAALGQEAEPYEAQRKIARWFWCGVFGELYSGTTETRFARDLPEVVDWVRGTGEEPRTVIEAQFAPSRLRTLRTRNSAAYKGLQALLMADGAKDWLTGNMINAAVYFDDNIDLHHIFPRAWCVRTGLPRGDYESIVNKTPLAARTNRVLGGAAPSQYLNRLVRETKISRGSLMSLIETHFVNAGTLTLDDFKRFYAYREAALLSRISDAIGKPIRTE
ncbi:GmrSD restriction endonuclease domain-containing protein [Sphaerimonospora sp. CA-214678]|uniref:GmrSD restriction endonuclease domain-containing protein n=1 Tax=Sphaerimonospora TaxID=1792303 RepID=UPI0006E2EE0E